jgi:hypothetical protein
MALRDRSGQFSLEAKKTLSAPQPDVCGAGPWEASRAFGSSPGHAPRGASTAQAVTADRFLLGVRHGIPMRECAFSVTIGVVTRLFVAPSVSAI